jgi:hypothetical protein
MIILIFEQCPANASSIALSTTSNTIWCKPVPSSVSPMAVTGKTEATGSTIHFKPSPEVFAITEFKILPFSR